MSPHPSFSAELLKLCGQMRDQMITPAESQRLNDMLLESKAARQFYLKFMSITSALETGQAESAVQTAAAEMDSDSDVGLLLDLLQMEQEAPTATVCVSKQSAPKQPKPQKTALRINQGLAVFIAGQAIRSKPARWFAAAAVLAIGILIAVQFIGPGAPLEPVPTASHTPAIEPERTPVTSSVATLTAARGARWDTPAGNLAPTTGESLRPGDRLTLTAGFAEITTEEGAVVILEAPATVELLDNDNAIRLHTGKLVGICETDSSKGFLVRTPHMDITDLGTEFGVQVTGKEVTTTVFTGEVELTTPGGETQSITVNQTARLRVNGNNWQIVIQDQLAQGFENLLRPAIVTDARINLDGFEVRVVPRGVREDAKLFTDRLHEINGVDENGIPEVLRDGDLVMMPADARLDLHEIANPIGLQLSLARPAQIYVLLTDQIKAPTWLTRDYERTSLSIGLDRGEGLINESAGIGPGNSIDEVLHIWKRKTPAQGTVIACGPISNTMYAVVAVPVETNEP